MCVCMMGKIVSVAVYCICSHYTSKMVSIKEEVNSMAQIQIKCHLVGQPLFKYQDDARSNTHKIQINIIIVLSCSLLTIASVVHTCVFESVHE